jgi:sulfur relay (sulfurtransferase) DsrF/TusC family protein
LVLGVEQVVNSIIILCEDSPFGKNSAVESIRMATGLLTVGDIDECKVIFMGDAVYFLNKNLNPEALNINSFSNIIKLIELSDLEIYIFEDALKAADMEFSDLISYDNIKIVNAKKISEIILKADMSFKY